MLSRRRTCISVLINAVLLLSTSTLQSVSFYMKTFWITAFVLRVCMYIFSPLRQGQQCFTTDGCLQLLSCQSFSHDVSCNTFWKLLIIWHWVWTKFFFCYCCCPVIHPVSVKQDYILNCCHVEGREWSCQSCAARICVLPTNPVLPLCHSEADRVALMLCEPGGLCTVLSWWQEEQVRRNCF